MSLSEEDKRRIEFNRQKALAIRQMKKKDEIVENQQKKFTYGQMSSSSSSLVSPVKNPYPISAHAYKSPIKARNFKSPIKKTNFSKIKENKSASDNFQNEPSLKAKCVLISRERFELDSPYFQPLIDICRTIESSVYNSVKKRWNFHLKHYKDFTNKIGQIKDKIIVESLPKIVTNIFSSVIGTGQQKTERIQSYDLRNVDKTILNSLFPFQLDAINFVVSRGGRALIADDMGLGKTIEALGTASYYRDEWPLLIISPANVRHTWVQAIHKFYSTPCDVVSPDTKKDLSFPSSSKYILVVSYDLMKSHFDILLQKNFRVVILDESHFIKDFKSERSKSAVKLIKKANRAVLLSGTPALSRPVELFPQLECLNKNIFGNYNEFACRYCDAKKRPLSFVYFLPSLLKDKFGGGLDASGASNLEELEIVLNETVMIRRLKDQVMSQLQPKTRNVFVLDKSLIELDDESLDNARRTFFDESLKNMEKRGALLKFYNETAKAKIKAVANHILSLLKKNRKMVVFAHHQLMMDTLQEIITSEGFDLIRIDGSTSSEKRQNYCDKFQSNDDVKVALLSITAANTGLTLTSANLVVFAELFWNPGILVQAEDRVHRVGQECNVEIQYLVAKGTADDEIWNLVKRKLDVLGKGGLSKDNFREASTVIVKTQSKDLAAVSSQTTLDDFWDTFTLEESILDPEPSAKKLKLATDGD